MISLICNLFEGFNLWQLQAAENKKTLQEHKLLKEELQSLYVAYDQLYQKTYTKKMGVKLQAHLSTKFNVDVIIQDKNNLNISLV